VLTDFIPNIAYPMIGFTGFIELFALAWWAIELWRTMNLAAKGAAASTLAPFRCQSIKRAPWGRL
jgi:hypothetical protein